MTYLQAIKRQCEEYAKLPGAMFIGYNTVFGSRMYKTLADVNPEKCLETPVAENLMTGLAMGMALRGMRPVLCFERHDFLLLAMDGIINHLDKLAWISGGQFKLPVIIRAIAGAKKPLKSGPMHTQVYTTALRQLVRHTPILLPYYEHEIAEAWDMAGKTESGAVIVVEYKDMYNEELPLATPPKLNGGS